MNRIMNMSIAFVFAWALTGTSSATTPKQDKKTVNNKIKIFLLSGQSNMTGRGTLEYERAGEVYPLDRQKSTLLEFVNQPKNLEKYS
jgi:hypothetical protein